MFLHMIRVGHPSGPASPGSHSGLYHLGTPAQKNKWSWEPSEEQLSWAVNPALSEGSSDGLTHLSRGLNLVFWAH